MTFREQRMQTNLAEREYHLKRLRDSSGLADKLAYRKAERETTMTLGKDDRLVKLGSDGKPLSATEQTQVEWSVEALIPAMLGQSVPDWAAKFMDSHNYYGEGQLRPFEDNGIYQIVLLRKIA